MKSGERADVMSPVDDAVTAVPEHDEDADERQRLDRRQEHRVDGRDVERRVDDLVATARRKRAESASPAPSPLTTRMPAIVSSASAVSSASSSWLTFVRSA